MRKLFTLALLGATALTAIPVAAMAQAQPFLVVYADEQSPLAQHDDVLAVAAETGQFTTFLRIVECAGMEETLRGEGPFTIFAPTDAAFASMSEAQLERLMDPRRHDDLVAFVSYHVVAERVTTESASGVRSREESASGDYLQIDGRDGLRVNDTLVAMQDIEASNGVIQGLNEVLEPPLLVANR